MFVSVLVDAEQETLDAFIDMYKHAKLEEDKMRILNSLCSVKDDKLIRKFLEFSFSVKY